MAQYVDMPVDIIPDNIGFVQHISCVRPNIELNRMGTTSILIDLQFHLDNSKFLRHVITAC